ncbi:hypothetical protein LEP1GSC170_4444 [Leptospira interrogans serovar Bataviae str. HAI135]|nr:hypothetical protein LEP1GSC170_4444 [Leptospira interrogans serovar Bataviae str. HAI135]
MSSYILEFVRKILICSSSHKLFLRKDLVLSNESLTLK